MSPFAIVELVAAVLVLGAGVFVYRRRAVDARTAITTPRARCCCSRSR